MKHISLLYFSSFFSNSFQGYCSFELLILIFLWFVTQTAKKGFLLNLIVKKVLN